MQCVYILPCLSLCVRGLYISMLDSQVDFGLQIYSRLVPGSSSNPLRQNLVFSPYGVSSVLGILQLGSSGETLTTLTSRLGYSLQDPMSLQKQHLLNVELSGEQVVQMASIMLVEQDMVLQKGFLWALDKGFQSSPLPLDFSRPDEALSFVNSWVSEQTEGTIPVFLQPGIFTKDSRLVLLNAMNFKGPWKFPFDPKLTQERPFLCSDGSSVVVPMMKNIRRYYCGCFVTAASVEYNVVELPYAWSNLSMLLVAPVVRHIPLSVLTKELSVHSLQEWRAKLEKVPLKLTMPRFIIESELDLKASLSSEGLGNLFCQKNADFSRITTVEKLYVSNVLQRVKVEVNEEGTEGSSATAAILFARMAVEEITLDRAFLFLIQHMPTGAVLFMGEVNRPQ
ncbi:plasminogen activator inhibitor 1-like [Paramormyrops kingsleyae]|uniref:Plasminogen activator inhibitor 1 n=1 Tax=Paramormyrops kingsleyae TaxID=1676925 RepID=A0A3B3Q3A4_9TELE|nr:plasminogen activator inhibitor 1-like [Paramormyrops kingsleyae]